MPLTNSASRYGAAARLFHWLTAALILTLIPLGLIAERWSAETSDALAAKATLFSLHKTLGLTLFAVAVARILWALGQPRPAPLHPERRAETALADLVHWLLYGAIVLMPLSGWISHAATTGFAPIWWPFGQSLPFVPKSPALAHGFATLHWLFGWVLIGTLALHIAGAVKHAAIDRDGTLTRMLRGTEAAPATPARHSRHPALAALVLWGVAIGGGALLATTGGSGATSETPSAAPLEQVASDWQVDDGTLSITVAQFGSAVTGSFADWTAAIRFSEEPVAGEYGAVEVTIAIGSLTLGSVSDQAMGAEYFDAGAFPTASFTAPIRGDGAGGYLAEGTLQLKGAEMPVTLPFTLTLDGDRAVMTGQTTLDRRNFGIGDSQTNPDQLGFEVVVDVELTATRQAKSAD
ncbi:MAG: cytochrome b/b6 domain-containing protein [Celeribacter sp.]|jgi:cytochrome b561/polyisoprenoid-binding protein YceI